jgi:hypothetical protein
VFVPIIGYAGLVIEGAIEALIDWLLSIATCRRPKLDPQSQTIALQALRRRGLK